MKKLFILIFIFLLFYPMVSSAETINGLEVEWNNENSYTLSWTNPSISKDGYVIKITDFDWKGNVAISITKSGVTQSGILSEGESTTFDFTKNTAYFDGIKITANKVSNSLVFPPNLGTYPCCPLAEITLKTSKKLFKLPVLEVGMSSNWDGKIGSSSNIGIYIKNTGNSHFLNGNITIYLDGLEISDKNKLGDYSLTYNKINGTLFRNFPSPLFDNSSQYVNFTVRSPFPSNKSAFAFRAEVYFKDNSGNFTKASVSETFSILDTFRFEKRVTPSTIIGERTYGDVSKGYMGLGKITIVNIYVENRQSFPVKSISLTDTIIKDFELTDNSVSPTNVKIDNTTLNWVFDLNSSESKEFRYELKPTRIGKYEAPASELKWDEFGYPKIATSKKSDTTVYGVFVVLTKKADSISPDLHKSFNVTLDINNIGDFPVGVNITDVIPMNAVLDSGETTFNGYLRPKQLVSLTYSIYPVKTGELEFLSPQITFWKKEYEDSFGYIPLSNIKVNEQQLESINNIEKTNTSIIQPQLTESSPKSLIKHIDEGMPWLEGVLPILMLFIAIILMLALNVGKDKT